MNTESEIKQIRSFLERSKGARQNLETSLVRNKKRLKLAQVSLENSQKGSEIIHIVAKNTQEELEYHLSDIVTMAVQGVFQDNTSLDASFVSRRGKIEVDLNFKDGNHIIDPMNDDGGGLIDVGALSTRFSCWAIRREKTRPLFLLDEPLKWLKGSDLPARGADMIKLISEKLGLQIIMVSHDPELIEGADKVIRVSRRNNRSIVK